MVFDKTGTLTEDGLQILGVRGTSGDIHSQEVKIFEKFSDCIQDLLPHDFENRIEENLNLKEVILNEAMASCHSITYVNDELIGDPLEIKMFESTNWELDEKNIVSNSQIGVNDLILAFVRPNKSKEFKKKASQFKSYDDLDSQEQDDQALEQSQNPTEVNNTLTN